MPTATARRSRGWRAESRRRHPDSGRQPNKLNLTEYDMKQWQCVVCGFIYDEAQGLPDEGIAPGTRWEDIPDDWACPDCGVAKADFEMVET